MWEGRGLGSPGRGCMLQNEVSLHRLYYFILCNKYTKDKTGWQEFEAECCDVDHKGSKWWVYAKGSLRLRDPGENRSDN